MSDDLKEEIVIGSNTTGVEAGVNRVKRSLADLGVAAGQAGKAAASGMGAAGEGGDRASKKVESATRSMQASLQRLIAEQQAGSKSSREYWEALASQRNVNVAALKPLLDQLDGARAKTDSASAATTGWRDEIAKVGPMLAGVLAGVSFAGFVGKLVSVQREFDVLYSSLKTVAGGAAAAEREMAWLKDFARETPFGLAQATQAFVKMKALGLEPTRAALTSFGNTASAMGKGLDQMIEAVADASTSEFERLKEFGIKAKQEGDKVELTFQGVTKTIGNNAQEIVKYLEDIGNAQFAGAMEERAKTLDGAISALGDTWDELFRTVNERNTGNLIYDSVTLATGAVEQATTVLRAMTEAASGSAEATGALKTIQEGIGTVFETVAVLGVNVAYTLQQVGNELGGLAAQAVQAAQFNFAGVRAIRDQMVADAETARREVDATTSRIMRARKEQEEYARWASRNASAATDPRRVDQGARPSVPGDGKKKSGVDAEARAYESLTKAIGEKIAQERAELESGEKLTESQKFRIKIEQELKGAYKDRALAMVKALEVEEARSKAASEAMKTARDVAAARKKEADGIQEWIRAQEQAAQQALQSVQERIQQLRDEEKAVATSRELNITLAEAIERVALARLQEKQAGFREGSEGWESIQKEIDKRRELISLINGKGAREASEEAAKKAQQDWDRTADEINKSLTDALLRGFESGKGFAKNFRDTLINMFNTLVLRPIISAIIAPVSGGISGLLGGGGGGIGAAAQAGSSAYNLASSGFNVAAMGGKGLQGLADTAYRYGMTSVGNMLDSFRYGMMDTASWSGFAAAFREGGLRFAGAIAGSVLNGFSGYGISKLVSGGYQVNKYVNTIGAIASMIPGVGPIAGLISGAVNRIFGRKLADTGIEGEFGGESGFAGRTYQFYKGGFLRSNKTKYGELDEEVRKGLADQFSAMKTSIKEMGKVLGLGGEALDKFTARIKVSLQGLSPEDAEKRLQEEFRKLGISMADLILGLPTTVQEAVSDRKYLFGVNPDAAAAPPVDPVAQANAEAFRKLQKAGESSLDTLTRLATSLAATNGVFETLGHSMYAASLQGGDMADKLVELFGGVEKFTAASADYFAKFYSAEEQREAARKQLEKQLATVNIKLPSIDATDARAQYRKLVEAQDLNTEAGRKAYAMLIQLAGAFDAVAVASQDAAAAAAEAARQQQEITSRGRDLEQRLLIAQGKDRQALDLRRLQEYYALLNLNPELAKMVIEIYKAEDAAEAVVRAQQGREDAYRKLQNAATLQSERLNAQLATIDAQRTALGKQRTLADESLALLTGIFDLVRSNVRELYGQVESTASMQAAAGWAFVERALETARRTGYLPDQQPLQEAIGAARSGLDERAYVTQFERDRDRLVLAGMLSGLEAIAGPQKTAAERQIEAIEAQGKALDAQTETINAQLKAQQEMLEYWRRQIDIANGTFDATLSVEQAVQQVRAALLAGTGSSAGGTTGTGGTAGKEVGSTRPEKYQGDAGKPAATWGGSSATSGSSGVAAAEAKYRRVIYAGTAGVGYEPVVDQARIAKLDGLYGLYHSFDGTGDLLGLLTAIRGAGGTLDDLSILSGYYYSDWVKAAASVNVPAFAVGTNYVPRDMLAQIHEGEAIVPKAFNPWANGGGVRGGADNAELVAEVRALRAEVAALRAAGERTADNTTRLPAMAEQFEDVTAGGNAMRMEAMN